MSRLILLFVLGVFCLFGGAARADDAALRARIAAHHTIVREDAWYGYHRISFAFNGRTAWVVEPKGASAAGLPWTWTMQWAEAFVDRTGVLDLLKRGFHHVTIDLFDTRMDEKGLAEAAAFQRFLVGSLGFAPKANLVGMSWGGFFSVRYAAAHPENVRRIYLDCPLLTFTGFASEKNPGGSWAKNFDWSNDPRMPVNEAALIAAAKIPVWLRYGGEDQTVSPALNAELFAKRLRAALGRISVHRQAHYGHHPHGYDPDKTQPIVTFFTE